VRCDSHLLQGRLSVAEIGLQILSTMVGRIILKKKKNALCCARRRSLLGQSNPKPLTWD
jgi:hypothetical protein